jgi:uncharacterized protein (TIGR02246 family)
MPLVLLATLLASATPDDAAVRAVTDLLQRQVAAWNAGDLEAFCASYAEDAAFIAPSGLTRGRRAVRERYEARYPDRAAMGRLSLEILEARHSGPTVSVAARWRIEREPKDPAQGLTLVVLHRRGSTWEIVQDASM